MSNVVFDGILKIKLSDEQISFIEQLELPPEKDNASGAAGGTLPDHKRRRLHL